MKKESLKKSFVQSKLKPGYYRDSKTPGFCLRVRANGKKSYVVKKKIRGTQKDVLVTIGDPGAISLDNARVQASEIILSLLEGEDPNASRREELKKQAALKQRAQAIEEKRSITLKRVLDDYGNSRNLKPNTLYIYRLLVTKYLKDWLEMPVTEITKNMIEKRHKKLSAEHPAQANHIMRILRALLFYASASYEDEEGKSLIQENPVRRLSQMRAWNRIKRRETFIRSHQLKNWYSAVAELEDDVRDYIMVLLLTGLRKSEASNLKWADIDFNEKTLIARDTKNYQDHMLPLSNYLYSILLNRWQKRGDAFVFMRTRKGRIMGYVEAIEEVIEKSGVEFTLHDLRRTFITTAEKLDIPWYALKKLLNHKSQDVTAGYIITEVERLRKPMEMISEALLDGCGIKNRKARKGSTRIPEGAIAINRTRKA